MLILFCYKEQWSILVPMTPLRKLLRNSKNIMGLRFRQQRCGGKLIVMGFKWGKEGNITGSCPNKGKPLLSFQKVMAQ